MRPLPLLVLAGLAACSDYDLNRAEDHKGNEETGGNGGPGTDTGETSYTDTDPNTCEDRTIEARDLNQNEECYEEGPTVGTFTPVVEWSKETFRQEGSSTECMMMPAVGSLTDDDGDGDADADDVPDVAFITYSGSGSTPVVLRVVSGDGGDEILAVSASDIQLTGGLALGDLDGDGWQDIVVALTNGVRAYDADGNVLWSNTRLGGYIYGSYSDNPAISDMDGDGRPEVIMGSAIVDADGRLVGAGEHGIGGKDGTNVGTASFAVDVDGDGEQEVVVGNALYARDGSTIWYNRQADGYPAVGNFDGDDAAEIVVTTGSSVRLQDDDGSVLCTASLPGSESNPYAGYYGGPPTVADFDGDGEAEFAASAGSRYSVFEKDCSVIWTSTTQDATSGNTGSSVFDFEGDGVAEAVYGDETRLWVFAGPDGSVKLESPDHTNNTWLEYPTIADVDGDDQAEIVVCNTAYQGGGTQHHGITVLGDADESWRSGRRIWNQHAYHITNVDDDGGIPAVADRNWLSYNNFRSGDIGAGGGYSGPDLVVSVVDVCIDECDDGRLTVWVAVGNAGYEDVDEDVNVKLYGIMEDGSSRLLDQTDITDTIPAARRMEGITFVIDPVPAGLVDVQAEVDEGDNAARGVVDECVEDNNSDQYDENLCEN
ncbi:MAG: FG-GAP repeat domain-containing protein [Myxococcota bacterium]